MIARGHSTFRRISVERLTAKAVGSKYSAEGVASVVGVGVGVNVGACLTLLEIGAAAAPGVGVDVGVGVAVGRTSAISEGFTFTKPDKKLKSI